MSRRILALMVLLWWSGPSPAAEGPSEYQVKAAFLYKFARFIEWPATSFADTASALVIGILGDDPFGPMLDQAIAGKLVQGRPLQILRLDHLDQVPRCHILFVGRQRDPKTAQILSLVGGHPVLSVGEADDFARAGGVIHLLVDDQRVFFEINTEAAQRAGLRISSQLLKLARSTEGGR
ncbi:MAG: YfiR family protein [Candidatus Latescibacteria bacterium]|nr:YfiR family protein [Candidatus Latescibacterota bacterium]